MTKSSFKGHYLKVVEVKNGDNQEKVVEAFCGEFSQETESFKAKNSKKKRKWKDRFKFLRQLGKFAFFLN